MSHHHYKRMQKVIFPPETLDRLRLARDDWFIECANPSPKFRCDIAHYLADPEFHFHKYYQPGRDYTAELSAAILTRSYHIFVKELEAHRRHLDLGMVQQFG